MSTKTKNYRLDLCRGFFIRLLDTIIAVCYNSCTDERT